MRLQRTLIAASTATLAITGLTASIAPSVSAQTASEDFAGIVENPVVDSAPDASLSMAPIGVYQTGTFDESASEIPAFHAASERVLVVNAHSSKIEILNASDPSNLTKVGEVSAAAGTTINSVAVREDGLAVAAVEAENVTDNGSVIFFDAAGDGDILGSVEVGALPDMISITENGEYASVANEGEPDEDYNNDPEGSVSVITLPSSVAAADQSDVRTASFQEFNRDGSRHDEVNWGIENGGVRISANPEGTTIAQDLEPEYISTDGTTAYVSLQENNAMAVVDLATARVERIVPLTYVDHNEIPLHASDRAPLELKNWPVIGISMPDSITAYQANGGTYIVTANEGDARDRDGFSEEKRIKDLGDPEENDHTGNPMRDVCEGYQGLTTGEIDELKSDEGAGRLKITSTDGLNEDGTCYEQLYSYGARGFSIYDAQGELVFNSDAQFEQKLLELHNQGLVQFNSNHTEVDGPSRSDDKGPEPEGTAVGQIGDRTYAFIGLERIGGVFVYDVTDPHNANYVTYVNNRDFDVNADDGDNNEWPLGGDLGAEGLTFVSAQDSPNGEPLLIVGNEVSGTTTIFEATSLVDDGDSAGSAESSNGSSSGSSSGSSMSSVFGSSGLSSGSSKQSSLGSSN